MAGHDETERSSTGKLRAQGARPSFALVLAMEASRPLAGGVRWSLDDVHEVRLGRGDARRFERRVEDGKKILVVEVPDRRMSSAHARVVKDGVGWLVEDQGSTNGTRIAGARIDRAPLAPGATLELGQTFFLLREYALGRRAGDAEIPAGPATVQGLTTLHPAMALGIERLKKIAPSSVPVMILGETGTGKEVLARAVHTLSKRPGAFVAVNCGALPEALVESQLFGHVKGAFSGAVRDEPGFVRTAHFGTLFLDEIGDLPSASQAALLRVLQEGEVVPVGSSKPAKVDIRVVCATHQPLDALLESGAFRRDLYARLAGFVHTIPPLRDRREDIGLLVAEILQGPRVKGGDALRFRAEAARALLRHDWPLNVRELEQCVITSSVLAEDDQIGVDELPGDVAYWATAPAEREESADDDDAALKRELTMRLVDAKGNVTEVARAMGKARQQIQRWLRRLGIDPEKYREG